jgi:hypothetical protein
MCNFAPRRQFRNLWVLIRNTSGWFSCYGVFLYYRRQGIVSTVTDIRLFKGLPEGRKATISELAERLQIQHHSTVELIDRMVERNLIQRSRDDEDQRRVFLKLTPPSFGGRSVEDVRLRFENGVVVEARAGQGQDYLDKMLGSDEGALRLGEFAFGNNRNVDRCTKNVLSMKRWWYGSPRAGCQHSSNWWR